MNFLGGSVTADHEKIPFFGAMFDVRLSILGHSGGLGLPLSFPPSLRYYSFQFNWYFPTLGMYPTTRGIYPSAQGKYRDIPRCTIPTV